MPKRVSQELVSAQPREADQTNRRIRQTNRKKEQMKPCFSRIHTISSKSHDVFLPWINTIKDVYPDIDVNITYIDQVCESGIFRTDGWYEATLSKLKAIEKMLDPIDGSVFVYSDTDVQFFRPFHDTINKLLITNDIVFQNDYRGKQCTGFFACKRTPIIEYLFSIAIWVLKNRVNNPEGDQMAMHTALKKLPLLKHSMLPTEFFTYGYYKQQWTGEEFIIPNNIVMHHANWTVGISNKLDMLQYVRDSYNRTKKANNL